MREPRAEDDEVISTMELVARLNGSTRVLDGFVGRAEAQGDADSWFYAGLAAWSAMEATNHSLRKHRLLVSTLDYLSAALRADPDHWPARFTRASYVTMLHSDEADEMVAFLLPAAYGMDPARQDAQSLIDLQTRAGLRTPYTLAPYCLAAVQGLMADDQEAAWAALRAGLRGTEEGRATAMAGSVLVPVVIVLRRPEIKKQPKLRAALARRCRSLAGKRANAG